MIAILLAAAWLLVPTLTIMALLWLLFGPRRTD